MLLAHFTKFLWESQTPLHYILKIIGTRTSGQIKRHITGVQQVMLSLPHIAQDLMNSGLWKLAVKEEKAN